MNPVQGYVYEGADDEDKHNNTICKIERRADVSDNEAREYGPAFLVRFGDDTTKIVFGMELSPWYPV